MDLQQWLNFISTELHKGLGALFNPALPKATQETFKGLVGQRQDGLAPRPETGPLLMSDTFTMADGCLFIVAGCYPHIGFALSRRSTLAPCLERHEGKGSEPMVFETGEQQQAAGCRYKRTGTPPFCDGSHNTL